MATQEGTENTNPDQAEDTTPNTPPNPGKSSMAGSLLSEVSEKISASGPVVWGRVVDLLTEKEVSNRVNLLEQALQKRNEMLKDLRKLEKADIQTFDANGKVLTESFSKSAAENLKKAREQLGKMENALTLALEKNDFSKLKEVTNK